MKISIVARVEIATVGDECSAGCRYLTRRSSGGASPPTTWCALYHCALDTRIPVSAPRGLRYARCDECRGAEIVED